MNVHEADAAHAWVHTLPKVDLHRHLEGSLHLETLIEVAQTYDIPLSSIHDLGPLVQIAIHEDFTIGNFLEKFITLRSFYCAPEIIGRIVREAIADAAADNVRYLELRFNPVALSQVRDFPLGVVVDWVTSAAKEAERAYATQTRLIIGLNRKEPHKAEEVVRLAIERVSEGMIVGLDLAGDETRYAAQPFAELFRQAKQSGLHITVHAGEWAGAENIAEAILVLGAERIGHGIRCLEGTQVISLARERKITFEVCLTSNYHSGVVAEVLQHPLPRMLQAGIQATLNTDDPAISQITLSHEYQLALEKLGLSYRCLKECILTASQAVFLFAQEKQQLYQRLQEELKTPNFNPTERIEEVFAAHDNPGSKYPCSE